MDRERSMQRLNMLTLAAFLLGFAAFVLDSTASRPAGALIWDTAPHASLDAGDWQAHEGGPLQGVMD